MPRRKSFSTVLGQVGFFFFFFFFLVKSDQHCCLESGIGGVD